MFCSTIIYKGKIFRFRNSLDAVMFANKVDPENDHFIDVMLGRSVIIK